MESWMPSDEALVIVVPIAVYWAYSGIYMIVLGSHDKYRLHSRKDEDEKNLVSKREVVKGVLLQQLVQASVAFLMFEMTGGGDHRRKGRMEDAPSSSSLLMAASQFFIGMFVLDTWQFFWHRFMHGNKFLYRHVHSWHHRLVVPYAFGSQYNHPLEGLVLDTFGCALAFLLSGMSPRTAVVFYSFATVKGIDDHCGLRLPGNIFHLLFWNNTLYHDVHHQLHGNKYNFSQPFFVTWDMIFGTYLPYV